MNSNHQYLLYLVLVAAILFGCNKPVPEILLVNDNAQNEIIYDGQFRYQTEKAVGLTIKLYPSSSNEGSYELLESLIDNEMISETSVWNGFYTLQQVANHTLIALQNTTREKPLRRQFILSNGKIREQNFRHRDLAFVLAEDHLELVDDNILISADREDFFYRRTSPEFTVEGYMTYRGDTSYFFETNTKINWPLTKLGAYTQAAKEHITLADKKNDTTYLKATAYSIAVTRPKKKLDALVLKKIIQSSSF